MRSAGFKGWPLTAAIAPLLLVAGYLILFWVLWRNRQLPYLWLLGCGEALNALVIFTNGGRMPVASAALLRTGLIITPNQWAHFFTHQPMTPNTHLPWLADVIPVRIPFLSGWWNQASPMSLGDLTAVAGVFLFVLVASGARLPAPFVKGRTAPDTPGG